MSNDHDPTAPSSLRWTKDGNNALKSLLAITKKKRSAIVMDALIEKLNKTVAQAPSQWRLLPISEFVALHAEIATIEELHDDNRRKAKIRTSDKRATEKIIKAVEKIDSETLKLQQFRWKLGVMAQLPESLTTDDLASVNTIAAALEKTAIEMTNMTEMIAQLESERDQTRTELAATIEQAATDSAKATESIAQLEGEINHARDALAAAHEDAQLVRADNRLTLVGLVEIADSLTDEIIAVQLQQLIEVLEIRTTPNQSNPISPEKMRMYEFELKTLKTLKLIAPERK